jgi:hypothetical protein
LGRDIDFGPVQSNGMEFFTHRFLTWLARCN